MVALVTKYALIAWAIVYVRQYVSTSIKAAGSCHDNHHKQHQPHIQWIWTVLPLCHRAGSPRIKEWTKRIFRMLATIPTYIHPAARAQEEAEAAAAAEAAAQAAANAAANGGGNDSDSDASSDSGYADTGVNLPLVSLPPSLYQLQGGRPAGAPPAPQMQQPVQQPVQQPMQAFGGADGGDGANGGRQTSESGATPKAGGGNDFKSRAVAAEPTPPPYLVKSGSVEALWGYPFGAPRSSILFTAKRAKRHRALLSHVANALAKVNSRAASPTARAHAGSSMPLEAGPALCAGSMYQLDSPVFWSSLPGHPARWEELSGPGDPVLLQGSYQLAADGDTLQVKLQVVNRCV